MMRPGGFSMLPIVVKNLLILNGLFFLATIVFDSNFGINLIEILGLHFPTSEDFRIYQVISYMFMHGDMRHIFFNMFAVWMFGSVLENYWGSQKFLIFYIITGIGAAFTHYCVVYYDMYPTLSYIENFIQEPSVEGFTGFVNSDMFKLTSYQMGEDFKDFRIEYNQLLAAGQINEAINISLQYMADYKVAFLNQPVVVGASGSLFGLLLAYGMLFPNALIYVFFAIPLKAKYFVILYGAFELYSGFANYGTTNIAHFAHLGGMLFGYFMIKWWKKNEFFN
jgi:membrane associated rhomboid family serine protease